VDSGIGVAKFAQHDSGMSVDAGRGAANRSLIDLEPRRGLGLPDATDRRLLEFRDDASRH